MGLFGKRKKSDVTKKGQLLTAFDKMEYFSVEERSNETLFKICDTIINGKAVLAKFDKISSSDANYMLSFISGVVYACKGKTIQASDKLFLFARKEEYEDGSLEQYVEDMQ